VETQPDKRTILKHARISKDETLAANDGYDGYVHWISHITIQPDEAGIDMKATHGVYFQRKDYAGFWLRLLADLIDVVVAGAVCSALVMTTIAIWRYPRVNQHGPDAGKLHSSSFLLLVILKRSKAGTVGYCVAGVRIIGPDGQSASWLSLTYRLLFAAPGPLIWFLDLMYGSAANVMSIWRQIE